MKRGFLFLVFILINFYVFSQGELEEKTVLLYRNERSGSFMLNSNGLGLNYRYAKRVDYFNKNNFEIDFVSLKNSKELKYSSPIDNRSFVYGKMNTCYVLRSGYGKQKEVFSKFDKNAIAIRYFYSGGVSLAFCKPYYYRVYYVSPDAKDFEEKLQTFDEITNGSIGSRADFSTGINKTKIYPGLNVKGGIAFEFGKEETIVNAIEVGIAVDAYIHKISIMYNDFNQRAFFSMFVAYRFGRLIDSSKPKEKKKYADFFDEQYQ